MQGKRLHILIPLLLMIVQSAAQRIEAPLSFTISRITPDHGLSQGSNYFRYEDGLGFMWMTGIDALNRFDGKVIKVYNRARYFKDCEPLQQGYGFAEDENHHLYIGSTKGLYIYHRKKDQFLRKKIFSDKQDVAMPIGYLNGKIWCFNPKWQLATLDVRTQGIEQITQLELDSITSVHNYTSSSIFYYRYPFIDRQQRIWCMSETRIVSWDCNTPHQEIHLEQYIKQHHLRLMHCSYDSLTNNILLITQQGLFQYDLDTKVIQKIESKTLRAFAPFPYAIIHKNLLVARDVRGKIILIDLIKDLVVYEEQREPYQLMASYDFRFDKSGRLWMCEDGRGQVILDFGQKLINKEPGIATLSYSNFRGGVSGFAETPEGNIMMQQAEMFTPQGTFSLSPQVYQQYSHFNKVLDTVRKGLWLFAENPTSADAESILFVNARNKVQWKFTEQDLHHPGRIKDLLPLADGRVLFCSQKGLTCLVPATKKMERFQALPEGDPFKINPLSGHRWAISYIHHSMKLFRFNKHGEPAYIQDILPGIQALYLQQDTNRHHYWAGTNQGIYLLDQNFNELKKFDANTNLAGTNIYGLLLDDSGHVWCSHQHGQSKIDANTYQITNYGKEDGIQDWDYNNRAFLKARDGTLFFGGVSGFNYIKPSLKSKDYYLPQIYVDEIKVNGQIWIPDTNANEIVSLKLKSFQNNISFTVLVRDLAKAKSRKLFYRLMPIDTVWKPLSDLGVISFDQLTSGRYNLELGVAQEEGLNIQLQKSVSLYIATPFYSTWWFWAIIILLLQSILTIWIYKHQKRRQLLRKEQELASLQLASLEQQAFTALLNPHFIFNALNSIQHYINVQDRQNANRYLTDFASLIRKNFESAQHSFIPLEEEIENVSLYLRLEKMRFHKKFEYQVEVHESLDPEDWMIPSMLLQPLIENALIHGNLPSNADGQLRLSFSLQDDDLKIQISDNGIGLAHSMANKQMNQHKSRGMELIQKRIQALNHFSKHTIHFHQTTAFLNHTHPGHKIEIILPADLYEKWMEARISPTNL